MFRKAVPRLLDQLREAIRTRHYSYRTEQQYVGWVRRYIQFHGRQHPRQLGGPAVEAFLSHLAVNRRVSAATQSQALAALLFLYKHVLAITLPWLSQVTRARRPKRLPVVLTRAQTRAVLAQLDEPYWTIVSILYGSGLRLLEALRLRIKDVDLERRRVLVRDGKGSKDRISVLADSLVVPLRARLHELRIAHESAKARGFASSVKTTQIYTHILDRAGFATRSPLDGVD